MIIVKLTGGLGNQMFQYATGRRAAIKNQTNLFFDGSEFHTPVDTTRGYALWPFKIVASEWMKPKNFFARLFAPKLCMFREKSHDFDPEVLEISDNTYLDGFWQSENYFLDVQKAIRRELSLKVSMGKEAMVVLKKIKTCSNPVSLHVRRGDFAYRPITKKYHGFLSMDYYQEAVLQILSKTQKPVFFIFSDDPEWVKKHLRLKFPKIFVSGKTRDWEDLTLMSYCQHHITANSSFSWWGAWLGKNPDKIIVAPKRWFRCKEISTFGLLPPKWITLWKNHWYQS